MRWISVPRNIGSLVSSSKASLHDDLSRLIHLSNLSFIRLLGEQNGVLAPLNRQSRRDQGPRTRLEPREVSGRSAHSQAQKFRWPRMSMLSSRLLECIRQVSPPALPPGQVGLFLPPTRAIFQPLWEKPRAEREECLSTFSPARGRCALERSFPLTLLARCSVQEDTTSRRGRLLQMNRGRSSPWSSQQTPSDPPTTSDRHPIDAHTKSNLLLSGSRILISCCGARCRNTSSYGCRRRGALKLATPLSTLA